FQAEDGIRVLHVTGVQTCALPIFVHSVFQVRWSGMGIERSPSIEEYFPHVGPVVPIGVLQEQKMRRLRNNYAPMGKDQTGGNVRSEERRVGKECGWRTKGGP